MIIVTGTKRSGTSLWMQILIEAGFPPIGEAFPRNWGDTLKDANPEGFYESVLRGGIYYATNPNPRTGAYFFPEQVEHHVVKVFIPGLVRTDRAYIGRVLATVREPREYEASVKRLREIEAASAKGEPPPMMPPALEWWHENFSLVRDIAMRRYAVHVETYDHLIRDSEKVITEAVAWLGRGDATRAIERVRPEHRHFDRPASSSVPPEAMAAFDALYEAIDQRKGISGALLQKLDETNRLLAPAIAEAGAAIENAAKERKEARSDD